MTLLLESNNEPSALSLNFWTYRKEIWETINAFQWRKIALSSQ